MEKEENFQKILKKREKILSGKEDLRRQMERIEKRLEVEKKMQGNMLQSINTLKENRVNKEVQAQQAYKNYLDRQNRNNKEIKRQRKIRRRQLQLKRR